MAPAVYSHGHIEHVFGTRAFEADAAERGWPAPVVVAHAAVPARFDRYRMTAGYNEIINQRQFGAIPGHRPRSPHLRPSCTHRAPGVAFEGAVVSAISPDTRMLELAPVTAFGANASLAGVSQKTVLSTIRNTEVTADAVVVLAMEAASARQRQTGAWAGIKLGTFHRELRTQVHDQPGFTAHFRALSLVSAEQADSEMQFHAAHMPWHVGTYLDILGVAAGLGCPQQSIQVAFSNLRILELLIKNENLDRASITRHTQTPGYNVFDEFKLPLPTFVPAAGAWRPHQRSPARARLFEAATGVYGASIRNDLPYSAGPA